MLRANRADFDLRGLARGADMIRTLAIAVTGLGLGLAGTSDASAADPVRIGFSLPLTGIFAPAAPSQKNAYELWRDQVNASGGLDVAGTKRPVEFVMYDDQSDPGQGAKIYEKLIVEDKVDLLLGPWGTPHHVAVAGVLERHKFPMVGDTVSVFKCFGTISGIWNGGSGSFGLEFRRLSTDVAIVAV
jgi:Periplasmic binding protein